MTIYFFAAVTQIVANALVILLLLYLILHGLRLYQHQARKLMVKDGALAAAMTALKHLREQMTFAGPADEDELRQLNERLEKAYLL